MNEVETPLGSCVNTHSENGGMKVRAKKVEKGKESLENLKCGVDLDLNLGKQERGRVRELLGR